MSSNSRPRRETHQVTHSSILIEWLRHQLRGRREGPRWAERMSERVQREGTRVRRHGLDGRVHRRLHLSRARRRYLRGHCGGGRGRRGLRWCGCGDACATRSGRFGSALTAAQQGSGAFCASSFRRLRFKGIEATVLGPDKQGSDTRSRLDVGVLSRSLVISTLASEGG